MVNDLSLTKILKEPLVQFLLAGFLLFVLFENLGRDTAEQATRRIVVNQDALLAFLQFRSKTYNPESVEAQLQNLSAGALQRLIDDFVRQEALYREAKAIGLDEKDPGVRQRVIGQLQFINQGVVSSSIELSENDLKHYLDRNRNRYLAPATITFTHVYFSNDRHGAEGAERKAQTTLVRLNGAAEGSPVPFHRALEHGDRFLFHQNYVKQPAEEVSSNFGADMQRQLFDLEPDETVWHGPFRSPYGYHLVLVTMRTDEHLPAFDALRERLEMDAYQTRLDEALARIESSVTDSYVVEIGDALRARLEKGRWKKVEAME